MELEVQNYFQNYFHNMSALSRKFGEDIVKTRDAWDEIWDTMPESQQKQVIDESIMDAEVTLKYLRCAPKKTEPYKYKHTWFTASQKDLFNLKDEKENIILESSLPAAATSPTQESKSKLFNKIKNKMTSLKTAGASQTDDKQNLISTSKTQPAVVHKVNQKPKNPPPPPPPPVKSKISGGESHNVSEDASVVPKTGFDFLDNW